MCPGPPRRKSTALWLIQIIKLSWIVAYGPPFLRSHNGRDRELHLRNTRVDSQPYSWNYLSRNPSLACTFLATGTEQQIINISCICSSDPHVSDKGAAGAQRGGRGDTRTLVRV